MSLYGYERDTTPFLRKFAEGSALYKNAIASGAMTLSTHASIFTGLYARQHGAHFDPWNNLKAGRQLDDKFHTLSEILSEKGYLTMGVVANTSFLSSAYRLDQGFQYYDSRAHVPFMGFSREYYLRQSVRNILYRFFPSEASDLTYKRAENINREVFNIFNKAKEKREPFFLFINYMDAHEPYIPPSPFDKLFPGKDETFSRDSYFTMAKEVVRFERNMTEEERNHLVSQYDGEIAYLDSQIGKLIAELKKLSLYDNSLIIITSDHGEAFGSKDLMGHGVSVYQDQVFIPLIIKYPNTNAGHVVDDLVNSVDLMPTILHMLGFEIPENIQGQSLRERKKDSSRMVISESYPSGNLIDLHQRFDRVERAIFLWPYKFISSTKGKKELFDLSKDKDENENIYDSEHIISRDLEARLNHWIKTKAEVSFKPKKLDRDTLEHLKALGYIQ